eukprot:scaffold1895_cov59-Cyclotella_meneghiniana.AAC.3
MHSVHVRSIGSAVSFRKKKSAKNIDTVPGKEGDAAGAPQAGAEKPTVESREPQDLAKWGMIG